MDQRGHFGSFDPTETRADAPSNLTFGHEAVSAPAARVQAWARMASSRALLDFVPTQREYNPSI